MFIHFRNAVDHPAILKYKPKVDLAFVLAKLIDLQESLKLRGSYLNPNNWSLGPRTTYDDGNKPADSENVENETIYWDLSRTEAAEAERESFVPEIDYLLSARRLIKPPPKSCIENLRCKPHQPSTMPFSFSRISKVFLNYFGK